MSDSRADFLVEIGTEELPPKALRELELAFAAGMARGLDAAALAYERVESFATPRRLAVRVSALARRQSEQEIKRRGPPVSAAFDKAGVATRAATAFAESCGVTVDRLTRAREGKGEFLFFAGVKPGLDTATLLPGIVQAALDALPIPKRMRWGAGEAAFVRPVHWVVLLFGEDVVEGSLLDTPAGRCTRGHRFHAPGEIELHAPADYERALLERGKVIASFTDRRQRIREGVQAAARAAGGEAVIGDALLDEVTALIEWPVPLTGNFDSSFLALPREVLVATLQDHQRYFPVEDGAGALLPVFVTVANIESRDPAQVRAGNERVVRPRLADASFFFAQDRRVPLAERRPGLDAVTFQAKLGSVGARTDRIVALAEHISTSLATNVSQVKRCALLCKCDLLTAMVGEFPELQGIMGAYYAAADGEAAEVATGIREHYLPRGAGDALPSTASGTAVALADKLDTLAGIFAIGQKPTGTRDPFGLRRASIGLLRILIEKRIDLDLRALIGKAVALQPVKSDDAAAEVEAYIHDRLRGIYLDKGFGVEQFEAVLATAPPSPLDLDARLAALREFLTLPDAASLAAANKRIANILRKSAETAAGADPSEAAAGDAGAGSRAGANAPAVDTDAFTAPAERRLHTEVTKLRPGVDRAVAQRDYTHALRQLATLRPAVDAFFDGVMVMDPDERLRRNRLALLAELRSLFSGVADLSRLPG